MKLVTTFEKEILKTLEGKSAEQLKVDLRSHRKDITALLASLVGKEIFLQAMKPLGNGIGEISPELIIVAMSTIIDEVKEDISSIAAHVLDESIKDGHSVQ